MSVPAPARLNCPPVRVSPPAVPGVGPVLAAMAVVLNAVTTGDHLLKTLWWEPYWPVAGVDLSLLVVASVAGTMSANPSRFT
mgnify:CR=1 FL=1